MWAFPMLIGFPFITNSHGLFREWIYLDTDSYSDWKLKINVKWRKEIERTQVLREAQTSSFRYVLYNFLAGQKTKLWSSVIPSENE